MREITALGVAAMIAILGFSAPALAQDAAAEAKPAETAAPDPDAVVASVGGETITEAELALAMGDLDQQFARLPQAQRRLAALSALIDMKMLAQKAESDGLQDGEDFKRQLDYMRDRTLHNFYFQKQIVGSITEDEVKARYEKEVANTPPAEEIKASHILVDSEEKAKELIVKLDEGADFAKLAEEESTGPSAPQGGDLGYFRRGQMVPEFEAAAFALEPGTYTKEPVKTQFGWHVIKLEDKREAAPPPFEQVADQVRQVVLRERYLEVLEKAREETAVDVKDNDLKSGYEAANTPAKASE